MNASPSAIRHPLVDHDDGAKFEFESQHGLFLHRDSLFDHVSAEISLLVYNAQ